MMIFETCRDYTRIARAPNDADAPEICRSLELERADGYAVVAVRDGQVVADAEGWRSRHDGPPPFDAATATGMYDY